MNDNSHSRHDFALMSGDLSLDFANTAAGAREMLDSYAGLVAWGLRAGLLESARAEDLLNRALVRPFAASAALDRARDLRDVIRRLFSTVSQNDSLSPTDVDALNSFASEALSRIRLVVSEGGETCEWQWLAEESSFDTLIWPVAKSAADLLSSGLLRWVRGCAGEGCGRLFLDTSRNGQRRWCDMGACGNRAKVQQYRARRKAASDISP